MNLLFLGDSLIEFYDWQRRFPAHRVTRLGIAGESVEGLFSRLERVKGISSNADMVFIMTGINNIAMGDTGFIVTYKNITGKLSSLYPGAEVTINSLLPVLVDFIPGDSIRKTNASLKRVADDVGAEYLDVYSRFIDARGKPIKEYLLDDGVHLSNEGYAAWSMAIEEIISRPCIHRTGNKT